MAIDRSLRAGTTKSTTVKVEFRHDIFKFLFQNKQQLTSQDFPSKWFVDGWDQCYFERRRYNGQHRHYNGYRLIYPITINSKYLVWSKSKFFKDDNNRIVYKSKVFVEMISFNLRKASCNTIGSH